MSKWWERLQIYIFFQHSNMIDYISKMKWKFVILELKICNIEIVMSNLKNYFILVKAWGSILTESIVSHKQAVKLIVFP
jgi:hypothetical protein